MTTIKNKIKYKNPNRTTINGRKSTIRNSAFNAILPLSTPTNDEIQELLQALDMTPENIKCAYCGDRHNTFDHFEPLIVDKMPTGSITEYTNLIPSCSSCNSKKGNKAWKDVIPGNLRTRGFSEEEIRVIEKRIEKFEIWRAEKGCSKYNIEAIVGDDFTIYMEKLEDLFKLMDEIHELSGSLKTKLLEHHKTTRKTK